MKIHTFEELAFFIDFFKQGRASIILLSKPGLSKSFSVDAALKDTAHGLVSGHCTPYALYREAYLHRGEPLVIRDINGLLYFNDNISAIKMLTEQKDEKELKWLSSFSVMHMDEEIPDTFTTTSNILIETNDLSVLSKKIEPLLSRMWLIEFTPSREEILRKLEEIQSLYGEGSKEVLECIKKYAHVSEFLDLRLLQKGIELYRYTDAWDGILMREMGISDKLVLLGGLMQRFTGHKQRIEVWKGKGFSERSYWDHFKKLDCKSAAVPLVRV